MHYSTTVRVWPSSDPTDTYGHQFINQYNMILSRIERHTVAFRKLSAQL